MAKKKGRAPKKVPNSYMPLRFLSDELEVAIRENNVEKLKEMVANVGEAKMAEMGLPRIRGVPPLDCALRHRAGDVVKYLVFELNLHNGNYGSLLHTAVDYDNVELVSLLLQRGATLNSKNVSGRNALHICAMAKTSNCIDALFDEKSPIDIDAVDSENCTALHYAATGFKLQVIEKLISQGACSIGQFGLRSTPLGLAIKAWKEKCSSKRKSKQTWKNSAESKHMLQCITVLARHQGRIQEMLSFLESHKAPEIVNAVISGIGVYEILRQLPNVDAFPDDSSDDEDDDERDRRCDLLFACVQYIKKVDNRELKIDNEVLESLLNAIIPENSQNSVQALAALLCKPRNPEWITTDILNTVLRTLDRSAQLMIFQLDTSCDAAEDYFKTMFQSFIKMLLLVHHRIDRSQMADCLKDVFFLTNLALRHITDEVEDLERFCIIFEALFLWYQIVPETDDRREEEKTEEWQKKSVAKKLEYCKVQRPLHQEFIDFVRLHREAVSVLQDDDVETFSRYFYWLMRIEECNTLINKVHFIQSTLGRGREADAVAISVNRLRDVNMNDESKCGELLEFVREQINAADPKSLATAMEVEFMMEPGKGNGPLREFFSLISRELFHSNSALFESVGNCYRIKQYQTLKNSPLEECIGYYHMVGRILALAIVEESPLGIPLSRVLIKDILKETIVWSDIQFEDSEVYSQLELIRKSPVDDLGYELCFTVTQAGENGTWTDLPLIPNGTNILVTDKNKMDYIEKFSKEKMLVNSSNSSAERLEWTSALISGFYEILPARCLKLLNSEEVFFLILGNKILDVEKMRTEVTPCDFEGEAKIVDWFWEIVASMTPEQHKALLLFWSGSPVPPLNGFAGEVSDEEPWRLALVPREAVTSLPTASTCGYTLMIPPYKSKEVMEKLLCCALEYGSLGFDQT